MIPRLPGVPYEEWRVCLIGGERGLPWILDPVNCRILKRDFENYSHESPENLEFVTKSIFGGRSSPLDRLLQFPGGALCPSSGQGDHEDQKASREGGSIPAIPITLSIPDADSVSFAVINQ